MIFARDKSQMCNNLLQYAHVYAWGREHGRKVISMRFSYKYRYFKICHTPLTSFALYLLAKFAAALKLLPTASFKYSDCDKEALERMMLQHRNIVVAGWFVRYYDLFMKYIEEIRDLFTLDEEFREPVERKFKEIEDGSPLRLGVHIRRGDYKEWSGGRFYYDDGTYCRFISSFRKVFPDRKVYVYLSTNDPEVSAEKYAELTGSEHVYNMRGSGPEDLYMLSQCDYVIGPPSTFSVVATMYGKALFLRMDTPDESRISKESFRDFDYWFRRINEL